MNLHLCVYVRLCVCVCVYLLFKLICVNRNSGMEGRGQSVICLSATLLLWSLVLWTCPFSLRPAPDPDRSAFIRIQKEISPSVVSFTLPTSILSILLPLFAFFCLGTTIPVMPMSINQSIRSFIWPSPRIIPSTAGWIQTPRFPLGVMALSETSPGKNLSEFPLVSRRAMRIMVSPE